MSNRHQLLTAISSEIADYRNGEIKRLDTEHVDRWVRQFPDSAQDPILLEMKHVLENTYINKKNFKDFISSVISNKNLAGDDPSIFWRGVKFLALQTAGNSQRVMLEMFDNTLQSKCGFGISECGEEPHTFLYLDDLVYSGGRTKTDITRWIREESPKEAKLVILTLGIHLLGKYFAETDINKASKDSGKSIKLDWWHAKSIEDRKAYMNNSDVLRPTTIPADIETNKYITELGLDPVLRAPGQVGGNKFFSSEEGRFLLEQQFLIKGVQIRKQCPYLNEYMRPLGNSMLKTTGFGTMVVTFRNCPNNAPLVLWAGDPWYPLFPRKTN
ncbi:hypothetical protein FPV16_15240 [Methylobacterium sp. W2]|uniref:phosphoribosyltransferase-like protein n=1 Tax=Methylobacterium sp. W2 TaxID=2598107 RepID=UPI001D0CD14B|nr:hypothetical protein [Methylobacterium sp. W2]MCC0807567.1 hypothetical protein [Methylobacterium sp. W2]